MSVNKPIAIELLSPARNAEIGIEAVNCGADAVYIGAEAFGARHAAGNSVEDIKRLSEYAHCYGAKVYVTLNTIIYDSELERVRKLVAALYEAGVDALIVQDTALLGFDVPIPLHASTQMNILDADKVRLLGEWGFEQVVLGRELGLTEIAAIHAQCPDMRLEAFVHGALCVSYSGQCYASQHCFGRSANRGECAQFCRLAFDLQDAQGNTIVHNKHLLSLKDMNRSAHVEEMLDAGITSLKIEGRLKDMAYVKNVTAYYSNLLNQIVSKRPQAFCRASFGQCHTTFEPNLSKSFNRGFTDYFLHGRTGDVASINTPKALGEPVGRVKELQKDSLLVSGMTAFHNGDGLCFFTPEGELQGFRVNRADGNRLFPHLMPDGLKPKTLLFRNYDAAFDTQVLKPTPQRTVDLRVKIEDIPQGFRITAVDETGRTAEVEADAQHQEANKPQDDRIAAELRKTGGTCFRVSAVENKLSERLFIPASLLTQWRRAIVEQLLRENAKQRVRGERKAVRLTQSFKDRKLTFAENIANDVAKSFYLAQGAQTVEPAFELSEPKGRTVVMTCRHCVKYSLGMCRKNKEQHHSYAIGKGRGELSLLLPDGHRFPLEFDCKRCEMKVLKTE